MILHDTKHEPTKEETDGRKLALQTYRNAHREELRRKDRPRYERNKDAMSEAAKARYRESKKK